jgi:hypothetical protein
MPRFLPSRGRGFLITAGVLAAGASGAIAATPGDGTVSKDSPKVTWTGQVTTSYPNRVLLLLADLAGQSDSVPCGPQTCDSFKLKVADSDDLVLTADAPEGTSTDGSSGSQVTLRITKPDGSKEIHTTEAAGASPEKPLVVKLKKAPAGDYTIEYFNYFYGPPVDYTATATLGAVKPPAAPAAPATGAAPAPAAPAAPAAQEGLTVTAKVGKASAKKLNKAKKLAATVTVSRAVKSLTATLKSGSKVVGKGSLGGFSGTKKVSLRLSKKLKAGKYTLVVAASDGAGTTSGSTVAFKLAK